MSAHNLFWAETEAVLTGTHNLCFEQKYEKKKKKEKKKIQIFYLKTFSFLVVKLSIWDFEKTSLENKKKKQKKKKTSDIIQSQKSIIIACQLLVTCSVVSATADCRKYENFLRKKNNTTDRNVKKGPKSFYLILMKQKPNILAGFSAQNATSKTIPNCNLNELFVS